MRDRFDLLAKQIITTALEPAGRVDVEHQVSNPSQFVDVWFRPAQGLEANLAAAGLLGRMASDNCMIEPYRSTPGLAEFESCVDKQRALRREMAKRASDSRSEPPRLWVVSTGRPKKVIREYEFQPMEGWPAGCYRTPTAAYNHFMIVVSELPSTRETLLVRLLGKGPTFRQAAAELDALPDDVWEKQRVQPLLVAFVVEITHNREVDMEAREYLRDVRARYAEWEQRLRQEGQEKGRLEGRLEGQEEGRLEGERILLRKQLVHRFGDLPADMLARLDEATSEQLEQWGKRILGAGTLADIFRD